MSAILKVENLNVKLHHRRASKKLVEDVSFEVRQANASAFSGNPAAEKA